MFYFDTIQNASKDFKNMWEVINNVTGQYKNNNVHINCILGADGLIKHENYEIVNEFNNFFANGGKNIENDFDKKPWSWLNKKGFIHASILLTPIS